MSVNPELRSLDIDIPAQPQSLVQLSLAAGRRRHQPAGGVQR
jgi:hypothetical protein